MLRLVVDAILVLVFVEGAGLTIAYRRTGYGVPFERLLGTLGAGFALLIALRCALGGTPWPVWPCLLAALAFHLYDLRSRWSR